MAPSDSLTLKTNLDTKVVIQSTLVQKLWSKTSCCKMGGKHNAFTYVSHLTLKPLMIHFIQFKGLDPSYPALKFGDNLFSSNRDTAQNVILQGHDSLKGQGHP